MTPELASLMEPAQIDAAAPPQQQQLHQQNHQHTSSEPLKRKRSPEDAAHAPAPPPKSAKTNNHLQINYLARQYTEDLPLVSNDDTLPSILHLLGDYQGVLDRHESMACNLGARPLGPILIKRFERLFDGPPKVLKSHGKEGANVTWLDIVEFARNKPEQFQLGQMSEGVRVCQFYTKQCRVQISEEDFVLISSGIPQKMIPPQPIIEDEEKELGTIEILEKNLGSICHLADQVAARTRQLKHRLKLRQQAILDRRATDNPPAVRAPSPSTMALMNGGNSSSASTAQSPNTGFVAVNSRPSENGSNASDPHHSSSHSHSHSHSQSHHSSKNGASSATRTELLSKFFTLSDRRHQSNGEARRPSIAQTASSSSVKKVSHSHSHEPEYSHGATSPVPIPNTPSSLLPHHSTSTARPSIVDKDDGGPYKAEMVARMESLNKGERILPPCDRCRRLHMDCLKNLTACMGCTKKHAKCSWREVREEELRSGFAPPSNSSTRNGSGTMYDDMDDEPASVGQRTPPKQYPNAHPNTEQVSAAAAALQHHQAQGPSHTQDYYRESPRRSPDAKLERDVETQLKEAAKLASVEAERDRDLDRGRERHHGHGHASPNARDALGGYQAAPTGHVGSGIESH